jgi:hypothetical protein
MVKLDLRPTSAVLGTFKWPNSPELLVKRWETNGAYFVANYLLLFGLALVLSVVVGRFATLLAFVLIVIHVTFKTRTLKSKANLLFQSKPWRKN